MMTTLTILVHDVCAEFSWAELTLTAVAVACRNALTSYQEALAYAPNNKIAMQRMDFCRTKVERLSL
jgi:hypothetical protein